MNLKQFYIQYIDPRHQEYQSAYNTYLRGKKRILDVGCGVGNVIAFDPKHIEGIDHNTQSLSVAKKRGFHVRKGDVAKLPFHKAAFDGIFCGHVIEHLSSEKALAMLYEFNRILKPGGVIVLKTPLMYSRFYNDLTHIRPYPPEAIMDYLMHTEQTATQRTAHRARVEYRIVDLFYRYDFVYYPYVEPSRFANAALRMVVTTGKVLSALLYQLGIRNYLVKTGYTIVLEKK